MGKHSKHPPWKVGDKAELYKFGEVVKVSEFGDVTVDTDDGDTWTFDVRESDWTRY